MTLNSKQINVHLSVHFYSNVSFNVYTMHIIPTLLTWSKEASVFTNIFSVSLSDCSTL